MTLLEVKYVGDLRPGSSSRPREAIDNAELYTVPAA